MFDEFSSFVSEEQGQKIDGIGEWMKDNNSSIQIIAFSDNLTDKKADRELRSRRSEAIRKILIENIISRPNESPNRLRKQWDMKTKRDAMP